MRANKKVLGVAALAAMAAMGGTFAYFNQTMTVQNPFDTAKYGTVTVEDFKPEEGQDWKPGVEVNKDVNVVNTGDQSVVVRMKFKDTWENLKAEQGTLGLSEQDTLVLGQNEKDDGLVGQDKSVVKKNFDNLDNWTYNEADGYYYYKSKLAKAGEAGDSTGTFLTSVQLDPETDMGKYTTIYYATKNKDAAIATPMSSDWTQYNIDEKDGNYKPIDVPVGSVRNCAITDYEAGKGGYSDADYTLTITIETVQATDKAVAATFKTAPQAVVDGWALQKEAVDAAQN